MTDRHIGYVVTLETEVREDDAQAIITAMSMIKGVCKIEPIIDDIGHQIAVAKAMSDIQKRLWKALHS